MPGAEHCHHGGQGAVLPPNHLLRHPSGHPQQLRDRAHGQCVVIILLQAMIGCQKYHSSPYHSQENSVVERSHHTVNNLVRATLIEDNSDMLQAVQLTMNSAEHSSHTFSPAQLILGTNMCFPIDHRLPLALFSPQAYPN